MDGPFGKEYDKDISYKLPLVRSGYNTIALGAKIPLDFAALALTQICINVYEENIPAA